MLEGEVELLAGDAERAYDVFGDGHEALAAHSDTGFLATVVGLRAEAALRLGRDDEALELADETERLAQRDDFEPVARTRLVRAQVMAKRGHFERADELLRDAAALIEPTDYLYFHIDLFDARAEVNRLASRPEAERAALAQAVAAAVRMGLLVAAEQAEARLAELSHD